MKPLLAEIRHRPLLWLLAFVPVVFAAHALKPEAHTLLFVLSVLATIALLVPSTVAVADSGTGSAFTQSLSLRLAVLLITAYGLGMLFSLKTHREIFGGESHQEEGETPWPVRLALAVLVGVTVLVALVSEVFVESVQEAAVAFGMSQPFVGFIVVALSAARPKWPPPFQGRAKTAST